MEEKKTVTVAKGLDGVVVDETAVCLVDRATDTLFYRGYPIEEAAQLSYEEVSWLLIHGDLPQTSELAAYREQLRKLRTVPPALRAMLELIPPGCDAMEMLRTACSFLGNLEPEAKDNSLIDIGARLTACVPGMLLYWHHFHQSGKRIDTDSTEATVAGHFLHLLHGKAPHESLRRALDVSLIVYAEHDFNASTFGARVATSTLSDAYSAFVAAISTLRGPLHGSANASVLRFLQKFESPEQAEAVVLDMLNQKARIPGFGQRAYVKSDPRNAINRKWAQKLARDAGEKRLYAIAERVEAVLMRERAMFANIDYYTSLIYRATGIPVTLFPPMFFLARICGLVAHIQEQRSKNRLIHPSSKYIGAAPRHIERKRQLSEAAGKA